uniref:CID domain-containing protein n=1 Tax=Bracon brevicornis TaxID=1563983 RepID=A0A6V7L7E6_9HYME
MDNPSAPMAYGIYGPRLDFQMCQNMLKHLSHVNDKTPNGILNMVSQAFMYYIFRREVVAALRHHIHYCSQNDKLYAIYALHAIVHEGMEQGRDCYRDLFAEILIELFYTAFVQASSAMRSKLYLMRKAFNGMFKDELLYKLDVEIQTLDPAWPVRAEPPAPETKPPVEPKPAGKADSVNSSGQSTTTSEITPPRN